ncbi:MAG: gamma carbonic anhydrase family protein [Chloroflexota bacterium]|nr:gamma carbonic anhydrase family protein [Chloroflexota bacterium]
MLESFFGKKPKIAETAFVHPAAHIRGDVEIGDYSIIWPGASLTADWGALRIGKCVIIEDHCIIHAASYEDWEQNRRPTVEIGEYVTIGHGATIHGKRIGNRVMIGMNATILEHVEIGDRCIIAAGALVPEGMRIPDESFVVGIPAKIKGKLKKKQSHWIGEEQGRDETFYIDYIENFRKSIISD